MRKEQERTTTVQLDGNKTSFGTPTGWREAPMQRKKGETKSHAARSSQRRKKKKDAAVNPLGPCVFFLAAGSSNFSKSTTEASLCVVPASVLGEKQAVEGRRGQHADERELEESEKGGAAQFG